MLQVRETATGSVLFHQAPPKLTVAGGWFAIIFGCVMIFHPTARHTGVEEIRRKPDEDERDRNQ